MLQPTITLTVPSHQRSSNDQTPSPSDLEIFRQVHLLVSTAQTEAGGGEGDGAEPTLATWAELPGGDREWKSWSCRGGGCSIRGAFRGAAGGKCKSSKDTGQGMGENLKNKTLNLKAKANPFMKQQSTVEENPPSVGSAEPSVGVALPTRSFLVKSTTLEVHRSIGSFIPELLDFETGDMYTPGRGKKQVRHPNTRGVERRGFRPVVLHRRGGGVRRGVAHRRGRGRRFFCSDCPFCEGPRKRWGAVSRKFPRTSIFSRRLVTFGNL